MKTWTYVFALSLLTLSCSQGLKHANKGDGVNGPQSRAVWGRVKDDSDTGHARLRRLETLTWDSVKHQLTWDVSRGEAKNDGYQPLTKDRYEINMDKATMTVNGESRRFSEDEAANVRILMDFISKYAVESTVWWENGEGEPVDGKDSPVKPEKPGPGMKEKKEPAGTARVVAVNTPW